MDTNPHPRFGKHGNPKPHTLAQIADITAWTEAQTAPFTTMDAFRACTKLTTTYKASYPTTYNTLRELRDQGLLRQTNASSAHTHRYLHVSRIEDQEPGDAR